MSVLNENQLLGASGAGGDYEIEQSLRFNAPDTSYLSWTPASAGNRKTWTWSGWVKRGNLPSSRIALFEAYTSSSEFTQFVFDSTHELYLYTTSGGVDYSYETDAVFRDPSAWYHILVRCNTTLSTQADRLIVYVNGERQSNANQYGALPLNLDLYINAAVSHKIGRVTDSNVYLDGYLAEVNFIDGQALTPDSFGETGDYGEWNPTKYTGAYGNNGFYLPFKQDYAVEGFSTVTYEGASTDLYVGGTGFKPDLVWVKRRNASAENQLIDSVRGASKLLSSDTTGAELDRTYFKSFDNDGFSVQTGVSNFNVNGSTYVAWNWDMGGTTASNTSGSITSSVRANTTYGQSIVSYSGTGSNATIGHGLSSAPNMIICKTRAAAGYNWPVYHSGLGSALSIVQLGAQGSYAAFDSANKFNSTAPTSSVFSVGTHGTNVSSGTQIAYCFHDVTGYSKFGSYEGTGGTHTITTGFAPAFVMIKNADAVANWTMWDNTRNPNNPVTQLLRANTSGAEETKTDREPSFLSTGFSIGDADVDTNKDGDTYIYMAFADTREYAYWLDQSGNNNDWTSEGGLTESDVMLDSPTNNFSVMNVLDSEPSLPVSEGNTKIVANGGHKYIRGTFELPKTGKHYWEVMMNAADASSRLGIGIATASIALNDFPFTAGTYGFYVGDASNNAYYKANGSADVFSIANTSLDIFQIAYDADSSKIWFGHNNTFYDVDGSTDGNPSTGVNPTSSGVDSSLGFYPLTGAYSSGGFIANFGQDSSFAGTKTPQGNQDANGIGDFYYAPPNSYLALCTANLPSVDVIPSENFNPVLWTGNGTDGRDITNIGFTPDFVWIKSRSLASSHLLNDTIRGANKSLFSEGTTAETPNNGGGYLDAFVTDGFSVTSGGSGDAAVNDNGATYVAWNWKAGGSASSNSNGSITSSVSANPSAGFSIVSYTGTGSNATVGHGLTLAAPEMVIVKSRDTANSWNTWHEALPATNYVVLNSTQAAQAYAPLWNSTAPTSSVFSLGTDQGGNKSSDAFIAYAFHSVDGYSKVGSYTGNGSADGPFVHCGFRPAYVMVKQSSSAGNSWMIYDTERSTFNVIENTLRANTSEAEDTSTGSGGYGVDIVSNGFKVRTTWGGVNASGSTYIFLAFAENPFKHTNAR